MLPGIYVQQPRGVGDQADLRRSDPTHRVFTTEHVRLVLQTVRGHPRWIDPLETKKKKKGLSILSAHLHDM
jgi:hypothetical protein